MTIALAAGQPHLVAPGEEPRRRRRKVLWRVLIVMGSALVALIALAGSWIGISLFRIDHAVHHVGIPARLLARGKNDLLAIVKGPDHSEQIFVFHDDGGHTNVLKVPNKLGLPLADGGTVPIDTLSLHAPIALIAGLDRLGIPVSHYVGVDLHMVSPTSSLGQLATGQGVGHRPHLGSDRDDLAARAGGLAHLSRARDPGLGCPLLDERPHRQPRLGPDRQGSQRQSGAGVGVPLDLTRLPLVLSEPRAENRLGAAGRTRCSRSRHRPWSAVAPVFGAISDSTSGPPIFSQVPGQLPRAVRRFSLRRGTQPNDA